MTLHPGTEVFASVHFWRRENDENFENHEIADGSDGLIQRRFYDLRKKFPILI